MAHIPPSRHLAFGAPATSSGPQAHTKASTSKQAVDLHADLEGVASVDVIYGVVWTAGEPPSSWLQRPTIDCLKVGSPALWPPIPPGVVHITSSAAAQGSAPSGFQPQQHDVQAVSRPQLIPEGKISCNAMLDRGTLGGSFTCLYDVATDGFSDFSTDDGTWGCEKGYHDYGDIQLSTRKWFQGSWHSVEDDNGHDFLFLTVERDHGVVRVWRPNMVAKRIMAVGLTELTHEEILRLGLNENGEF